MTDENKERQEEAIDPDEDPLLVDFDQRVREERGNYMVPRPRGRLSVHRRTSARDLTDEDVFAAIEPDPDDRRLAAEFPDHVPAARRTLGTPRSARVPKQPESQK